MIAYRAPPLPAPLLFLLHHFHLIHERNDAVADRNAGEKSEGGKAPDEDTTSHSRWGLTAAEMREFCIKPVSQSSHCDMA